MSFDINTWKYQIAKKIPELKVRLKSSGVNTLYYFLAATSLVPIIQAVQSGDAAALTTLSGILAGAVSTNIISNVVQKLKDKSDTEIAQVLQEQVSIAPGLKAEIDVVLEKLDTLNQVSLSLSRDDKEWFTQTLQEEMKKIKNEIYVNGDANASNFISGDGNKITQNYNYYSAHKTLATKGFRLYNVPNLPENFLLRQDDLQTIIKLPAERYNGRVAITGRSLRVGVQGMGGVGKSVLAAAIARNPEVEKMFPDGVFWIAFGQDPVLSKLQEQLGNAIDDPAFPYISIQHGRASLDEALKGKTCLIILDDIWKEEHAEIFDFQNNQGCVLVTSRNRQAMETFRAQVYYLDVLKEAHSLNLLSNWAGYDVNDLPKETIDLAKEITKECGYLPLALAMAGALVKEQGWEYVLYRLQSADLSEFSRRFPYDHPNLLRAIQVSIENLPNDFAKLYMDFAVFPEDTSIPIGTLQTLWAKSGQGKKANDFEVQKAINLFASRSLLQKDQKGMVILHDLQMDYIRKDVDLKPLHQKIVDAYRRSCSAGWHTGPNDGYFFQRIAWHLVNAGIDQELYSLLLDYRWLKNKLLAGEINSLISEYDMVNQNDDQILWLIKFALSLSRHVLSKDKTQLPSQLIGRLALFDHKNIDRLLDEASRENAWPWLKPLTPSLTYPGTGELMTLEGHNLGVRSVTVLPNGKQAISASEDRTLRFWDLEDGRCLRTLNIGDQPALRHQRDNKDRGGYINALVLTHDQKYLLSAMHDGTIKVWNLEDGTCAKTFEGHTERVYALALTEDGKRLFSGSGDKTVKIWNMGTGDCLNTLTGHTGPVRAVVISEYDNRVFSGDEDGVILVWHLSSGRHFATFDKKINDQSSLRSMSLATFSKNLATSDKEGSITIWNRKTGSKKFKIEGHKGLVSCLLALKHNGNELIASASRDRTIKIWEPDSFNLLNNLEGHSKSVNCIASIPSSINQSKNGARIISASEDATLKIWDLNIDIQQQLINKNKKIQHRGPIKILTLVDGEKKLVSASQDGFLKCWNMENGEFVGDISRHQKAVSAVAVTADKNTVFSAGGDKVIIWDIKNNRKIKEFSRDGKIQALTLAPNERKLALSLRDSSSYYDYSTLEIINLENSETKTLRGHIGPIRLLNVTSDGKYLISGGHDADNKIKVWDFETGLCIHTIEAHRRFVISMALTPNGKQFVAGLWNAKIKIWDIEHGNCLRTLEGHTESVHSLAITPDGKMVVSGSWDRTLRAWSIETGECLQVFKGHSETVNTIFISPNGKYIISAANDNTLKVWDIYNGKCVFTYWADVPIYTTIVSSVSDEIVAGDQKGKIHFLKPMVAKITNQQLR